MSATVSSIRLGAVEPTVFLRSTENDRLDQQATMQITCAAACPSLAVTARAEGRSVTTRLDDLPAGESTQPIYVPELSRDGAVELDVRDGENSLAQASLPWRKPKRWTVHVVQLSHHDAGYTDLKSSVLELHNGYFGEILDMAEETRSFPDDAQFRMTVEQTWSIDHFLKTASPAQAGKMLELMKSGHVELTALFGNMVTHLCGHETLGRALYHAFAIKRRHGIPIVSAQHNDVPGFAWGLASVLTQAGIKLFVPALPYFWSWTVEPYGSFWDQDAVLPGEGPGAFWWEAPSGKRVLLWCDKVGCNGDRYGSFGPLGERLRLWEDNAFPFDTVRWPVCGGFGDNSPYLGGFAAGVKKWNETWAFPRLVSSTNAKFYADIVNEDLESLPVFRGELPEADNPVGALSTARSTAASRNNHASLLVAERLAMCAAQCTDYAYPTTQIARAYEDTLWFDEHTWGFHLPCGPAVDAAKLEKAVHAHRAQALAHDVVAKAMARIADSVQKDAEGVHLVVFNALPFRRTCVVSSPLRGLDNCGSDYNAVQDPSSGDPLYFIVPLTNRGHVAPSEAMRNGNFELLDLATGEAVPFQLDTVGHPDEARPYAPERYGVGAGEKRLGGGEDTGAFRQDLAFVAEDVPACGYKTYRIVPTDSPAPAETSLAASDHVIENAYYRIEVDPVTGSIASIIDKTSDREVLDRDAKHPFGAIVVRDPHGETVDRLDDVRVSIERNGPVSVSIVCRGRIHGHPAVTRTVTLHRGQRRIEYAIRVLKDATPLLDAHAAFPFKAETPKFRYEGVLSLLNPIVDFFPGAYSDNLPVQNWVKVGDGDFSVLWSSLDSPTASLGDLWPGHVSPAHRSIIGDALNNDPLQPEDLRRGWIYSYLFNNNFGTNFAATQPSDVLFRYVFTTRDEDVSDADAVAFGWDAVTPPEAMFTQAPSGPLPPANSFMEIENPHIVLLASKKAEDGRGWIIRLWNTSGTSESASVRMPGLHLTNATAVDLVEEDAPGAIELKPDGFRLEIDAGVVQTVRCT